MRKKTDRAYEGKLHIRLLDRLEIIYGNQSVETALKKSRKARSLVSFLILNQGKPVSFSDIHRALWGNGDAADLDNVLKVLVSRTRSMFVAVHPSLRDCIISQPGAYRWNMDMTAEVDVFEIEALCTELCQGNTLTEAGQKKLESLMCLYTGNLLPEEAETEWVKRFSGRLEEQFKSTVFHALSLLHEKNDAASIVKICRMGLATMPFESQWHEAMMQALVSLDRQDEALAQYEHVTNLQYRQMRGNAASGPFGRHGEKRLTDNTMDQDVETLSETLRGFQEIQGAQMCEYSVFKYIYEQQLRIADRHGFSFYLVLFKVSSALGDTIQPLLLENIMQKLGSALRTNLRKGDTIARYTPIQYVVMLQDPAIGSVRGVLERVRLTFHQAVSNAGIVLDYRYKELEKENTAAEAGFF